MTGLPGETEGNENDTLRHTNIEAEIKVEEVDEEAAGSKKKVKVPNNIQDKGPALAEMVFAGGSIVGPMVGGALDDWKGYDFTVVLISSCALFFAILYTIIVFCPDKKAAIKKNASIVEARSAIMAEES